MEGGDDDLLRVEGWQQHEDVRRVVVVMMVGEACLLVW